MFYFYEENSALSLRFSNKVQTYLPVFSKNLDSLFYLTALAFLTLTMTPHNDSMINFSVYKGHTLGAFGLPENDMELFYSYFIWMFGLQHQLKGEKRRLWLFDPQHMHKKWFPPAFLCSDCSWSRQVYTIGKLKIRWFREDWLNQKNYSPGYSKLAGLGNERRKNQHWSFQSLLEIRAPMDGLRTDADFRPKAQVNTIFRTITSTHKTNKISCLWGKTCIF